MTKDQRQSWLTLSVIVVLAIGAILTIMAIRSPAPMSESPPRYLDLEYADPYD